MKKLPRISEAEWQVMKLVWARSRATTNEVVEALAPLTAWKPKTIMTLLKRLATKQALGFEKKGRLFEYYPLVKEADCVRAESRSFLQRVYGGAVAPMLTQFIEDTPLTLDEVAELKRLLEKRGR
jgi:BlaI family transcriptional regulator, penicillinase repressor